MKLKNILKEVISENPNPNTELGSEYSLYNRYNEPSERYKEEINSFIKQVLVGEGVVRDINYIDYVMNQKIVIKFIQVLESKIISYYFSVKHYDNGLTGIFYEVISKDKLPSKTNSQYRLSQGSTIKRDSIRKMIKKPEGEFKKLTELNIMLAFYNGNIETSDEKPSSDSFPKPGITPDMSKTSNW